MNVEQINSSSSSSGGEEEKTFDLNQQAPLQPPSKIGLQELRNFVQAAYNKGIITDSKDLNIYHTNIDAMYYKKVDTEDKKKIKKDSRRFI